MKILKYKVSLKKPLFWLILTVLSSIIGLIVFFVYEKTKERHSYVAVLITKKQIDFEIAENFMHSFEIEKVKQAYYESKDGHKVEIRQVEDFMSEGKTAIIAEQLSADKNCILVIGNANSTLTNINLDIFLNSDNRLPLLMPIATDNNLLAKAVTAEHRAVLRMLPDNSKQADTIEKLVKKLTNYGKVAIYGDEENQSYSINLSRDIADKVRKIPGIVVIEELIGPTNSFYNSVIKWTDEGQRPEIIIYVGVSHHGLLLLDQFSELKISVPIIFTDGCLVPSLLPNSEKLSGPAFILSPINLENEDRLLPSYGPIGTDAYYLAKVLINSSNASRQGVYDYIANHRIDIFHPGSVAGKYKFDQSGGLENRDYIVYEIRGGRLIPFDVMQ